MACHGRVRTETVMRPFVFILLASSLCSSCLSATWNRSRDLEAIAGPSLDGLKPGEAKLEQCLQVLGAPTRVWEVEGGAAMAWHWVDLDNWGLSASVPTGSGVSANLSYNDISEDAQGAVLFFDSNWRLLALRSGQIAELLAESRRRPTFME